MNLETAGEITAIIMALVILTLIISLIIVCLLMDNKRTKQIKQFKSKLTTEQKALISDYDNCYKVFFKRNKKNSKKNTFKIQTTNKQ